MKTRNGFVSNSSSSSFIVSSYDVFDEDFIRLVQDYVFYIELDIGREKDTLELYDKLVYIGECEVDYDPRGVIGISNYNPSEIRKVIELAKLHGAKVRLCTGGTSSDILPQAMIQSYLIDKNVDYEVVGDGSFDLRSGDDIDEIFQHYDYPGPAGALMKHYRMLSKN